MLGSLTPNFIWWSTRNSPTCFHVPQNKSVGFKQQKVATTSCNKWDGFPLYSLEYQLLVFLTVYVDTNPAKWIN
jgi:hypothetical protein